MKDLLTVLLAVAAGIGFWQWHAERDEAAKARTQLEQAQTDLKTANDTLKARDSELAALKKRVSETEANLQATANQAVGQLTDLQKQLQAQRAVLESKQKAYQALVTSPKGDGAAFAVMKQKQDELQLIEQKLKAVSSDLDNTKIDASDARGTRKSEREFRVNQAKSRLASAQELLRTRQAERRVIPKSNGAQINDANQAISEASQLVAQMKSELDAIQNEQRSESQVLENHIHQSVGELTNEKNKLAKERDAKKQEIQILQAKSAAAGGFQKERDELLKKLALEIAQEAAKLKTLEDQVRADEAKSKPVH